MEVKERGQTIMIENTVAHSTPRLWGDKRYHTWNYYLRQNFGEKVFKVPLDAGFTCPNRDGKITTGGCTFCSARGSGDFAGDRRKDLSTQFETIKERMHQKWPQAKYMGYFQAYTNTYAPVSELRDMYEEILNQEGNVALAIATRPDCLPDDVIELLAELNERTHLWVELGLQTVHDRTGERINRGHDYQCYVEGVEKLRKHQIRICSHIIYGLPHETEEMMLETATAVSKLDIQGLKIHLLHVMKKTPLAKQYAQGEFTLLEKDQYIDLVVRTLEILPPDLVIQRLTGDAPQALLIGPKWSKNKWDVLNSIDRTLTERNTWQGKFWKREAVGADKVVLGG
jgi:radical SAM protein (TIGR01212 family)